MIDKKLIDSPEIVEKAWGIEMIIANNSSYCGKILKFNPDSKFSMHFHIEKHETWCVLDGSFQLDCIYTLDATKHTYTLIPGDVITIEPGFPHQLYTVHGGRIMEVSTPHHDNDSYRIEPGDSQK